MPSAKTTKRQVYKMKTTKNLIAVGVALLLATSLGVSASAWDYRVEPGDSFWKISQKLGVDFSDLIANNPCYENPDLIYPNDVISVPEPISRQVLSESNSYRALNGLAPLSLDSRLSAVAQAKAEDMAENGYFSHTSSVYGTPSQMLRSFGVSYGYMGENIAKGYDSPYAVVKAWMSSTGHRANILGVSFNKMGVGYSADGKIWVQLFTD